MNPIIGYSPEITAMLDTLKTQIGVMLDHPPQMFEMSPEEKRRYCDPRFDIIIGNVGLKDLSKMPLLFRDESGKWTEENSGPKCEPNPDYVPANNMNPTLKGIDQWPNTAPALDASYSATQEDRIISMKEPSEKLKKLLEDLNRMTPEEMEVLKLNLICKIAVSSLATSSPATPWESPERVETAEEAWKAFWKEWIGPTGNPDWFSPEMKAAFIDGYEAGRKAK